MIDLDGMRDLIQTCLDAYARRLEVVMECEALAKVRAENNMLRGENANLECLARNLRRERDPSVEDALREDLDALGCALGRAFGERNLAAAERVVRERDAAVQALAKAVEALQAEYGRREVELDRAEERLKRAHSTIREFVHTSRRLPRLERQVDLLREQNARLQSGGNLKAFHAYISRLNRAQYVPVTFKVKAQDGQGEAELRLVKDEGDNE